MPPDNVLLIILDSVRARNMSLYGYHRETTPYLDEFSSQSAVFTQAKSPGIHSVASHASLWTGKDVHEHGLIRHEDRLQPDVTIWETLASQGYDTGLFTTNPVVAHSSNLASQFQHTFTDEIQPPRKFFEGAHSPIDNRDHEGIAGNLKRSLRDDAPIKSLFNCIHHAIDKGGSAGSEISSNDLVSEFLEWQAEQSEPWAACINLMDAHFPYEPAKECDRWGDDRIWELQSEISKPPSYAYTHGRPWWELAALQNLYDGTIRELDSLVERLVEELREKDVLDDTLVVVTSDHGEGFAERSHINPATRMVTHSWGVHECLTHVPLLVRYPDEQVVGKFNEVTSLRIFPQAVTEVLGGSTDGSEFITDSEVYSLTHRLREEDAMIFNDSPYDVSDYRGPWIAVYEEGETIHKHMKHDNKMVTVEIRDAQVSYPIEATGEANSTEIFPNLEENQTTMKETGEDAINPEVESRLSELGYIR